MISLFFLLFSLTGVFGFMKNINYEYLNIAYYIADSLLGLFSIFVIFVLYSLFSNKNSNEDENSLEK